MKLAQYLLALIAAGSVLAFGGVEAQTIAAMDLGVAALAIFVFWKPGWPDLPPTTTAILAFLVLLPWFQILPFAARAGLLDLSGAGRSEPRNPLSLGPAAEKRMRFRARSGATPCAHSAFFAR